MKSVSIILLAVLAMSFAQGDKVHVVEQSSSQNKGAAAGPGVIVPNPDQAFYKPSQGQEFIIQNPDPFFYQPSGGPGSSSGSNENPQPYPYKKYDNPYARGGK